MFIVNRKYLVRKTFVGELFSAGQYEMDHLQESISAV
jgi:hypothetical protein